MMAGRPAVYATFASYDEVAHHSGLERADTLEALRKLDQQFGRIERARRYAPRPYEIVVLSDHGQTQGATFLQRNGYGLEDLVRRSLSSGTVAKVEAGDENDTPSARRSARPPGGRPRTTRPRRTTSATATSSCSARATSGSSTSWRRASASRSRRSTSATPTSSPPCARTRTSASCWCARREHGAVAIGAARHPLPRDGRVQGEDPLAPSRRPPPRHLLRTDGFPHVADIMVNSFYDPQLDEGCAFEELISFHGGMGGMQTRAFIMCPVGFPLPEHEIIGAEAVHGVLLGWRRMLQGSEPDDG